MSLEKGFEALTKRYQFISYLNQELKDQNKYLRRQLKEAMKQKQKQKVLDSLPKSGQGDEGEAESHDFKLASEGDVPRRPRCERRSTPNLNDFRFNIQVFEGEPDPKELA